MLNPSTKKSQRKMCYAYHFSRFVSQNEQSKMQLVFSNNVMTIGKLLWIFMLHHAERINYLRFRVRNLSVQYENK